MAQDQMGTDSGAQHYKTSADLAEWEAVARRSAPGGELDGLDWHTSEGLRVKPLYTAADIAGLPHIDTLPGFAPYVRGPQATADARARAAGRDRR